MCKGKRRVVHGQKVSISTAQVTATAMAQCLDEHRDLLGSVADDLWQHDVKQTGRQGLPGEAVLHCALLKQGRQLSCEELAFRLEESASFRAFARLPWGWSPKKSMLHKTISAIRAQDLSPVFGGRLQLRPVRPRQTGLATRYPSRRIRQHPGKPRLGTLCPHDCCKCCPARSARPPATTRATRHPRTLGKNCRLRTGGRHKIELALFWCGSFGGRRRRAQD